MNPLVLAIPVFLVLAVIESVALGRRAVAQGELISGIACGTLDQLVNVGVSASFLAGFAAVSALAPLPLSPHSAWTWVAAVVLHDVAYYLFHRASHRVNLLWAAHAVHHQSERYTLAVSLRQGTIATWVSYPFYLPLALAGVPLEVFVAVHGAYQIYQFAVHTRLVPALGPLEHVLATPMLHRVHHGKDDDCLDKNYGGFFIVWDRLFNSYAPYTREPQYGVTTGLQSWSPFWANLHPYATLLRRARRAPSMWAALGLLLRPPEWSPPWDAAAPAAAPQPVDPPSRLVRGYAALQLMAAVAAGLAVLWPGLVPEPWARIGLGALALSGLFTVTAMWDGRRWALQAEATRLALAGAGTLALTLASR